MTPEARSEAWRLTESYGAYETFAESCAWADGAEAKGIHNSHWINLEPESTAVVDCPADCVLKHLETERLRLADPGEVDEDRAEALMFIGHFIGDLHNPVHVAYGYDRGGNEHPIEGLGSRVDNLHALWDRYLTKDRDRDWRGFARDLHDSVGPNQRARWVDSTPLDWANESFAIARTDLYEGLSGPDRSRVPESYVTRSRGTAEERLQQAGVRLGDWLNRFLVT